MMAALPLASLFVCSLAPMPRIQCKWRKCSTLPKWSREKYPASKRSHPPAQVPVMSVLQDYLPKVYSYEELLQDPLPPGVDSTRLEHYLTEEEFEKVFKMTRSEFVLIPAWKA